MDKNVEEQKLQQDNQKIDIAGRISDVTVKYAPHAKNRLFVQIFATISGSLSKFTTGMMVAWSSPAIPQLLSPDSDISITSSEGSWITSGMQAGSFVAVFLMAVTVDRFGRKFGILCSCVPILICWLMIAEASTPEQLFVARFVGGLGSGYGKIVIGTYIGEIAQANIRGALGTSMGIIYILGVLFSYSVGPFVSIRVFAWISMAIPITLFVTFAWMPESPYFYFMRGADEKARRSLERLRGHSEVDVEFERIKKGAMTKPRFVNSMRNLFGSRHNLEALTVICALFLSIQFTGKIPLIAYSQAIFENAGGSIPAYVSPIITCLIQLLAMFVSTLTIDRLGRRPLLIASCIGCGISLGALAIYFYVQDEMHVAVDKFSWVPLVSLIVYNFVFNIGLGNIPFIMVGELFPAGVKSIAVCLTSLCLPIASIFMIKTYQLLVDNYGMYTPFAMYTVCSFLSAIYCVARVPETKGKTLEEIQHFFT